MTALPWRCPCGRKNRKNAWHCPDCRTAWTYGTPVEENQAYSPRPTKQRQDQGYAQPWQWQQQQWDQSYYGAQQRDPSPRQRQHGQGQRRRSRRGKKAKQNAPDQQAPPTYGGQPPLPPPSTPAPTASLAQQPLPPPPLAVASAPKAPVLPTLSEEALKLRALTQKLKKYQDQGMELPEDVQNDLKDVCVKEAKSNRKTLHLAVNAMDDARQVYDDAVRARSQLHSQWKGFLAESLKLWQQYTVSFQTQEQELTARIQQAKDAFVQARDAMNAAKLDAANMVPVDDKTVMVSDDEEIKDLKDVPMAAAERIASGLTNLVETMSALHHQTEELVMEEQRIKRPRVQAEPGDVSSTAAPAGSASQAKEPPFGGPGGQ